VSKTLVEQYVEDPKHMRLFQQERAIYEITELIESVMAEQGIGRSQLAAKLGQSKAWITQLLDGERNKTIRTVADVLAVLGREYCSFQRPIQIHRGGNASTRQASVQVEQSEAQVEQSDPCGEQILAISDHRLTAETTAQYVEVPQAFVQ
jgi:transcriptional regulator with XRE-family HTH domain